MEREYIVKTVATFSLEAFLNTASVRYNCAKCNGKAVKGTEKGE